MVKRSRVLADEVDAEASVAYDETRLARRAVAARPRVRAAFFLGALLLLLTALATRSVFAGGLALAVAATAWALGRATLAPLVFAGLEMLAALGGGLWAYLVGGRDLATLAQMLAAVGLVAYVGPFYVVLLRDQELRHAYGLWARRG